VVKVVLWSRGGGHLTKPGWSKPHTHSNPTNLALFRRKIALYRFNQGGSYYCRGWGSNGSTGAELPPHFNHCWLHVVRGKLVYQIWTFRVFKGKSREHMTVAFKFMVGCWVRSTAKTVCTASNYWFCHYDRLRSRALWGLMTTTRFKIYITSVTLAIDNIYIKYQAPFTPPQSTFLVPKLTASCLNNNYYSIFVFLFLRSTVPHIYT